MLDFNTTQDKLNNMLEYHKKGKKSYKGGSSSKKRDRENENVYEVLSDPNSKRSRSNNILNGTINSLLLSNSPIHERGFFTNIIDGLRFFNKKFKPV